MRVLLVLQVGYQLVFLPVVVCVCVVCLPRDDYTLCCVQWTVVCLPRDDYTLCCVQWTFR